MTESKKTFQVSLASIHQYLADCAEFEARNIKAEGYIVIDHKGEVSLRVYDYDSLPNNVELRIHLSIYATKEELCRLFCREDLAFLLAFAWGGHLLFFDGSDGMGFLSLEAMEALTQATYIVDVFNLNVEEQYLISSLNNILSNCEEG